LFPQNKENVSAGDTGAQATEGVHLYMLFTCSMFENTNSPPSSSKGIVDSVSEAMQLEATLLEPLVIALYFKRWKIKTGWMAID
jgi:hypothetical protein